MKAKTFVGALLVSVILCSPAYSFDLLGRVFGNGCGCDACSEPQCCEELACCEECGDLDCCGECIEPECCEPCCTKKCDLFAGLKGLFTCKRCNTCSEVPCCEEVECCDPEPEFCEPEYCEPECRKPRCRPLLGILDSLFGCKKRCGPGCCEDVCETCGGYESSEIVEPAAIAPLETPLQEVESTDAPLDPPPADPSASMQRSRIIYRTSYAR